MNCITLGPDGRMYWGVSYGDDGPMAIFAWDPKTRTRSYLGTLTLGGDWLRNVVLQGIAVDRKGNLALHCLYLALTPEQQKLARWQPGTTYRDYDEKPYYLGAPAHKKGTFYSVVMVRGVTKMR